MVPSRLSREETCPWWRDVRFPRVRENIVTTLVGIVFLFVRFIDDHLRRRVPENSHPDLPQTGDKEENKLDQYALAYSEVEAPYSVSCLFFPSISIPSAMLVVTIGSL